MTGMALPLLDALRMRMSWLNARQAVLSQNVAHSDMPDYQPRELKPLDFATALKTAQSSSGNALTLTDPRHIAVGSEASPGFSEMDDPDVQKGQPGDVEEEMMKVADTQAQYQAAVNLYAKAMSMMRTAIDRNGS